MTSTSPHEGPDGERYTIDELARLTGMTVRNLRAHQSTGLLPPPELRGRTGYYGREHRDRLELIQELQADGFNLQAIRRILDALPAGAVSELLGFERALKAPWGMEQPEIVDADMLASRFPGLDAGIVNLERAEAIGVLRRLDDGRIELRSPTLARAAQELYRLGIPLTAAAGVQEVLNRHARAVARTFVDLFLEEIWRPFDEAGQPDHEWERIRHALEVMRPLAMESLVATFRMAMTAAADEGMARVLQQQRRRVEAG